MVFWPGPHVGVLSGASCGLTEGAGPQEKKQQLDKVQQTLKEMAEIDHWQASAAFAVVPAWCALVKCKLQAHVHDMV